MTNTDDAVKWVEEFLVAWEIEAGSKAIRTAIEGELSGFCHFRNLMGEDLRTILAELDELRAWKRGDEVVTIVQANEDLGAKCAELYSVLEYAANNIDGDKRRGIFIKAYVEGEEWAIHQYNHGRGQTND